MKNKVLKTALISYFLLAGKIVSAQEGTEWTLQVDWPDSPMGASLTESSTIAGLVQYLFEWGIVIGIILTFGTLIYASFKYITSTGNSQKLTKAKNMLSSSFLGLLLLFSSWLLISILNPELAVISKVGVPTIESNLEIEKEKNYTEDNLCDYGIVSYNLQSTGKKEKAFIREGDIEATEMNPYSSIVCKSKKDFGDDVIEEGENENSIRFVEARSLDNINQPLCNIECAQELDQSCEEEEYISLGENEASMPKYCYDQRSEFQGRGASKIYSVLYISQKPDVNQTTCLAGDEKLIDGGGCSLNLYRTTFAGRCGQMITSTSPTGNEVASSYDKPIKCIEIVRHASPLPENVPNIDFAH